MKRLLVMACFGAGTALAAGAPLGCGKPFTVAASTATGGGGGTGGGSASSSAKGTGAASASASTGTGGSTPACTPGMGVTAGSCSAGEYCDSGSGQCAACSVLTRMQFGAPVPLGVAQAGGVTELFPRSDPSTGDLYLVLQAATSGNQSQIATAAATAGQPPWMAPAAFPPLSGTSFDTGPLYVRTTAALAGVADPSVVKEAEPVLLFDSNRTAGKTEVFALPLGSGTTNTVAPLTLPGDLTATIQEYVAVAVAAASPRFFWLSNAGGHAERLVTALGTDLTPTDLPLTLDNGCLSPLATMPWVTPGGDWLFFASTRPEASGNCGPPTAQAPTHLYVTQLDAKGQQAGTAKPVFGDGDTNLDNSPSLWSPGLCALLFTRFDATTSVGSLYAAQRD